MVLGSQSSEYLPSSDSPDTSPWTPTFDKETIESPREVVDTLEIAALRPLPSPGPSEADQSFVLSKEEDDDYENPSRRHTIVAALPEDNMLSLDPFDASSSTSSLASLHPPPLNFLDTGSLSSLELKENDCELPGSGSNSSRQRELLLSMKGLSDSETHFQRAQSTFLAASNDKTHPSLRHVVSLNLLGAKKPLLDINGPPSARSLPLETRPPLRKQVSSKLRLSFRRRSTFEMLGSDVTTDKHADIRVEASSPTPDTPPQLAPLSFGDISLGSDEEDVSPNSARPQSGRYSLHNRSRSTPLLKESLLESFEVAEGKKTGRRTSFTAKHNLLLLPPLRDEPLSPPPVLDLKTPSQSEDDWLQSVLKAANESASGS